MERLWGEVAPVADAERMQTLRGGETVEGMRVAYTPGHASHHVCFLHEETGDAYVGDMAGVRLPGQSYTVAPTPPPDIDVEAWLESVDDDRGMEAERALPDAFRPPRGRGGPARAGARVAAGGGRDGRDDLSAAEFATWSEAQTRAALDRRYRRLPGAGRAARSARAWACGVTGTREVAA